MLARTRQKRNRLVFVIQLMTLNLLKWMGCTLKTLQQLCQQPHAIGGNKYSFILVYFNIYTLPFKNQCY